MTPGPERGEGAASRAQLSGIMTEDDGFRAGGGSRQVERWKKGLCSQRPFGPAPRRVGARGPPSATPSPGRERARSSLLRPWLTLSFCLSLQWKSRWLVLRKPSPVAGKRGPVPGEGKQVPGCPSLRCPRLGAPRAGNSQISLRGSQPPEITLDGAPLKPSLLFPLVFCLI